LGHYRTGFALIAGEYVGSSGAAAIPSQFAVFEELFRLLPPEVRADWQSQLRADWSELRQGKNLLLARLEELY